MLNPDKELLLLDTHVWIWLMNGEKRLKSSKDLPKIEKAARHSQLVISAISFWEIGMLEAKGRIQFSLSCPEWLHQALSVPGIIPIGLTPEIAVESSRLPGYFHADPADRIIVATARQCGATLVTADKNILNYKNVDTLRV
ncbi:MAG: type II toxin-antitoxin system VapC family toxin [Chlamydiae bacterium]|nr:type II toxin-antitoxin system VapC family toxin [Chlamydiota bacterium]MBI3266442.1 type II toxin-antitoxin system VapC family toxin [Chlamydiota bacterium]